MAQTRPNIVLIMADDMGWGDVGANWPETIDTPEIDQLAREGLRWVFHSNVNMCNDVNLIGDDIRTIERNADVLLNAC